MNSWLVNSEIYQILIDPILSTLGYPVKDKTFGRKALPISTYEEKVRSDNQFHKEKFIKGEATIYYQTWWNKEKFPTPKADLIHVHGYGDYGGRYADVASHYLNEGYRLHLPDLPAHGRSDGVHCHLDDINLFTDSVKMVLKDIKLNYDINKIFLSGGSLGGFVVTKFGIENPKSVDGIIAVCPCISVNPLMVPPQPLIILARFLRYILPRVIGAPREDNLASKDPKFDEEFKKDIHTYSGGLRVAFAFNVLEATIDLESKLKEFNVPVLIQQGDKDRMVSPESTQMFYEEAKSKDKQLIMYSNMEHELHRVTGSDKVFRDAIEWINSRL